MTKQTSFRADETLLNEFQAALKLRGKEMSPMIEAWIRAYMRSPEDEGRTLSVVRHGALGGVTDAERKRLESYLMLIRAVEHRNEKALSFIDTAITQLRELISDGSKRR